MALSLSILLFFISSILALIATEMSESLLAISMLGIGMTGIYVVWEMGARMHIYTALFFLFHLIMAVLAVYVYLDRAMVVTEGQFSFSTFTVENLRIAVRAFVGSLMVIVCLWAILRGRDKSILKGESLEVISHVVGHLGRLGKVSIWGLLLGSFAIALFFFLTNVSVLDVSYPNQGALQWVPRTVLKIPTIMATVGLLACYAKRFQTGGQAWVLFWARANFVLTLVLMLFLVGSRGFFTFLWSIAGMFEIYLAGRKRGSYAWAGIFMGMSWLAFTAWPTVRFFIAIAPLDYVLRYAWETALALGANIAHQGGTVSGLWVGDFPMIGTSLFQMLYVIQLIKGGISLGGATFMHLFPQALPGFLSGVLWVRPVNDNWLLSDHYISMGGFLDVANAYWNGGMTVMLAYVLVVSSLLIGFDRYLMRRRTGVLYKLMYWLFLPVMVVQMGYGIQGFARVIELLLFMVVVDQVRLRRTHAMELSPLRD